MKKLTIEILIIACICFMAGIVNNTLSHNRVAWIGHWPSLSDLASDSTWNSPSYEEGDPPTLNLAEATALYQNPEVIFIDARLPEEYEEGHISGSYLLPMDAEDEIFDSCYNEVTSMIDSNTPIVTYCSGVECESSLFLARYFREMGFENVKIFYGGWRKWEDAGLPIDYPETEHTE